MPEDIEPVAEFFAESLFGVLFNFLGLCILLFGGNLPLLSDMVGNDERRTEVS